MLRNPNTISPSPDLAVFVLGPDFGKVEPVAQTIVRAFGGKAGDDGANHLAGINTEIFSQISMATGVSAVTDYDLAELAALLPYDKAVDFLRVRHEAGRVAVLAAPDIARLVPFWQEAAVRSSAQIAAVLVVPAPSAAGNGAGHMLAWLQHVLLAERVSRRLTRRIILATPTDGGASGSGHDIVQWIASLGNMQAPRVVGASRDRSPSFKPGASADATAEIMVGFNSWIRRCESALTRLARQGESQVVHRELDHIQASLDAALTLFLPLLSENRIIAEQLASENDRLRRDQDTQADARQDLNVVRAEIAMLQAQETAREVELTAARDELAMLRHWCDETGSRNAVTQAELFDTRLKHGRSIGTGNRAAQALIVQGERHIRRARKPLARWIMRRGWGYKAVQRMQRHIAIIEAFLDDLPWPIVGVHPDGRRQRIIAYLMDATDALADFPLVQDVEYNQMYPDVVPSGMKPLVHFIQHGQAELRNPHPLFDTAYYLAQSPEAAHLAASPAVHYLRWGKDKGHDPHPLFSTRAYQQRYPDIASINPLLHWIEHYRNTVDVLFDPDFYLTSYPDIVDAGRNPLTHYLATGWREGRNPNPWFDTRYYLAAHGALLREGDNPLVHYAQTGWHQRLRPAPNFDPVFYLAGDPGLTDETDPLRHYIDHGRKEGRKTTAGDAEVPASPAIPAPPSLLGRPERVVLMVEALYPRPDLDSGSLDHLNFARIFQRLGYEVHYLSLLEFGRDHDEHTPRYRRMMEEMGVYCVDHKHYAYYESYYFDLADRIDVCFVSRVHFGGMQIESLRRLCPNARIVFNTVDLHFMREEREGTLKKDPALVLRARRTREMELDFAAQSDATILVSSSEKTLLDELAPTARTHVVPLIRQFDEQRAVAFADRRDIAFVGGFNHQPNIDAIEHFLTDIWPHVQRRRPDIGFRVVGANMPAHWSRRKEKGVTFVGFVEDLDGELARLRMTVAPLRYGAGAKGKLVSSLAAGVPAVVSAIASEGMGLNDGETVLVADGGEAFAERIIHLYDDEVLWTRLSRNGAAFIRQHYSIDTGLGIMRQILAEVGVAPITDTKDAGLIP